MGWAILGPSMVPRVSRWFCLGTWRAERRRSFLGTILMRCTCAVSMRDSSARSFGFRFEDGGDGNPGRAVFDWHESKEATFPSKYTRRSTKLKGQNDYPPKWQKDNSGLPFHHSYYFVGCIGRYILRAFVATHVLYVTFPGGKQRRGSRTGAKVTDTAFSSTSFSKFHSCYKNISILDSSSERPLW